MAYIGNYERSVSLPVIRAVWRAVSARPHASSRELGDELRHSNSTIAAALWHLEQAGYIERPGGAAARALRVVVPFVEVRQCK